MGRLELQEINPMRKTFVWLFALALCAAAPHAQNRTAKALDIYVVDVEGGASVLFVPAGGESFLIDTGNGGAAAARDAARIAAAAKDAGISRVDHLVTTHWHGDHFGGMAEVAKLIPIKNFYDHGANVLGGQRIQVITDVGVEPRNLRRA